MSETYDNKRIFQPFGLKEVDKAFLSWWDSKLNLHTTTKDGTKKKVPVIFVAPERWSVARESGIRDDNGTLILPIIAISRTGTSTPTSGPTARTFADTKTEYSYATQIDPKSSLIKNLIEDREYNIDPSLPIYEIYAFSPPDHYQLTYEVSIWSQYIEEMNEIIEKIGQEYDYKSVKSFQFNGEAGFYFVALQDDDLSDDSNHEDYTDSERIVRREYTFQVPAYIMPESNERKPQLKRYFSQTKIVFKTETAISEEELRKIIK